MSVWYGNSKESKFAASSSNSGKEGSGKGRRRVRRLKRAGVAVLIVAALYLTAVFSNIPFIKYYRDMWISSAMSTMRHQWLATYFIPRSVIDEVLAREEAAREEQIKHNSDKMEGKGEDWLKPETSEPVESTEPVNTVESTEPTEVTETSGPHATQMPAAKKDFYRIFYELDLDSTEAYLEAHPEALANGYSHLQIDESALYQDGTSIRTTQGEKVLAIDMVNKILVVEVDAKGSRGVLAIAKDPSRLHLYPSAYIGSIGETAGSIAKRHDGILAMTGSSFIDEGGMGLGGEVAGLAICDGTTYGYRFGWGYKRLELHEDNWFYITNSLDAVGEGTTDAMEFSPALVVNGEKMDCSGWAGLHPRACIGQSSKGEILMIGVEGRRLDSPGCSVEVCADILLQHDCITAMNVDGGTTSMVWYNGHPILQCNNAAIPEGRTLPNAWVYLGADAE